METDTHIRTSNHNINNKTDKRRNDLTDSCVVSMDKKGHHLMPKRSLEHLRESIVSGRVRFRVSVTGVCEKRLLWISRFCHYNY